MYYNESTSYFSDVRLENAPQYRTRTTTRNAVFGLHLKRNKLSLTTTLLLICYKTILLSKTASIWDGNQKLSSVRFKMETLKTNEWSYKELFIIAVNK